VLALKFENTDDRPSAHPIALLAVKKCFGSHHLAIAFYRSLVDIKLILTVDA